MGNQEQKSNPLFFNEIDCNRIFGMLNRGFAVLEIIMEGEHPADLLFKYANDAFEQQTGFRNLGGKLASEVIPYLEPERIRLYAEVGLTGESTVLEEKLKDQNRWYEVAISPFGDLGQRQIAVLVWDITEHKEAQLEMTRIKDQLQSVVEHSNTGMILCSAKGEVILANERGAAFTGFGSAAELTGQKMEDIAQKFFREFKVFHENGRPLPLESSPVIRVYKGEEEPGITEIRVNPETGERKWFYVKAKQIRGHHGQVIFVLFTFTDLTLQKEAESEITRIKDQLEMTILNSSNALMLLSVDGQILNANKPAAFLHGFDTLEDLLKIGRVDKARERFYEYFEAYTEEGKPYTLDQSIIPRVLKGEESSEVVLKYIHKATGKIRWFLMKAHAIREFDVVRYILISGTEITTQKESEESHRKNEAIFKTYAEALPQMAFIADNQGDIIYYNKRWYDYVSGGISHTDGSGVDDVFHPDDLDETTRQWQESLRSGVAYEVEYRLRRHDGVYRWHLGRAEPVRNENGEIDMWLGTNTDIHERRVMEDELKAQHELINAIMQNATTGILIMDDRQYCSYLNPAAERMTGFSLEEIKRLNKPLHDIIHYEYPDGRPFPIEECAIDRAFPQRNNMQGEDVFIHKDGSFYPVAFTASPLIAKDKPVGTVIEVRNIANEKKAAADLLAKNEKLSYQTSLLEALQAVSPMAVLVVNPKGRMINYNKQFVDLWQIPEEVLESGDDLEAMEYARNIVKDSQNFLRNAQSSYQEKKPRFDKLVFVDGRIIERYGSPILNDANEYRGYVWFFLDVTEHESLLRQKDDFIGIASHELKTPVTSIQAYAQVLKRKFKDKDDQETYSMLVKMEVQLHRLTKLIVNLLDITKIQQGRLELKYEELNLTELVKEMIEEVQRTSYTHQIQWKVDADHRVKVDRERISQVLINLLTNAIKYSPKSDSINVGVVGTEEEIQVSVQDYGLGLSDADRARVFERFYRVGGKGNETFPGLGLGLYISSEIIQRHRGRMWAESSPGKGSTFYFAIPRS